MSHKKKSDLIKTSKQASSKKRFTGINFKIYENGDLYVGNLIRGKIQGAGIMFFENPKIRCEGVWVNSLLNGTGRQVGPLREKYIGEFSNGVKNGQGRFTNKGKTIIGQFKDGEINGLAFITDIKKGMISRGYFSNGEMKKFGTLNSCDNRYHYAGYFTKGVFEGLGKEKIGGSNFFGFFKKGLRSGIGKSQNLDGVKHAGGWSEGDKSGFGVERYPSGDMFEGEFLENLKNGIGRYHHKNDSSVYTGTFKDGLRHGFGRLETPEFIYIGDWNSGMRHGNGYQYYKNGVWYYGEWHRGLKHGFGYETRKKIFYKGEWQNDKPHGFALVRDHENVEKFAVFEFGILKELSVNIPKRIFEYFDSINLTSFLEKSELRLIEFEDFFSEEREKMTLGLRRLDTAKLDFEKKKLFGILQQISLNVENMEISFEKILKNLEIDLKKANIDMKKLMISYKYDLNEEKREDVVMVMDANRSLKSLDLLKNEEFEKVESLERRKELKEIKRGLEKIFEDNFEGLEKEEEVKYFVDGGKEMKDKNIDTEVLESGMEVTEKKKSELEEVVSLLMIEKEDLKKRKEEIVLLLEELRNERKERIVKEVEEEEVNEGEVEGEVEETVEVGSEEKEEERKVEIPDKEGIQVDNEKVPERKRRFARRESEDVVKFDELSRGLEIRDFELEFGENNSKVMAVNGNAYYLTNKNTVHLFRKYPDNQERRIELLKSTQLGKKKKFSKIFSRK